MTHRIVLVLACFVSPLLGKAQIPEDPFFRMTFNEEKRVLVEEFMKLTAEESAAFWPIYNAYEVDRQAEGTIRLRLLESYIDKYPDLSEAEAEELVNAVVDLEVDMAGLRKKYFRKMKKALSARRAMAWLQMEIYLELQIRTNIYDEIPFLNEE